MRVVRAVRCVDGRRWWHCCDRWRRWRRRPAAAPQVRNSRRHPRQAAADAPRGACDSRRRSRAAAAAPPAPAQPAQPRTFTAPAGLLFNTVRADRVDDFEKAMGYLQAALAEIDRRTVRAQAKGWRIFKATEAGPGGTVLYVFVHRSGRRRAPTTAWAGFSRMRIPIRRKLQEIWKLYTGSVTGGSLLNLTPVETAHPPAPDEAGACPPDRVHRDSPLTSTLELHVQPRVKRCTVWCSGSPRSLNTR